MCGIAGIVGPGADAGIVAHMGFALRHRGPDGDGAWNAAHVALGHRRLAIVDLVGGLQPMTSASGRWTLIFNGEIYNHTELRRTRFANYPYRTSSDTEVILAGVELEGAAALPALAGMFSIAAWDQVTERLLLARDGQGIKPLYYARSADTLFFASEIGALEAGGVPLKLDESSLQTFLDLRFIPPPRTIFQGVFKLPPGHSAFVGADATMETPQPFAFKAPSIERSIRQADAQKQVTDALLESVGRQMMADVPVGILLSGGVDSAVVTAAATRTVSSVSTFCVGYADTHSSNEFVEAKRTADLLKTDHHELTISADHAVQAMPRLIRHLEEPVVTTSIFSLFLLCEEVARHRKVVLTGQGADEPWGGYGRHRIARLLPLARPFGPLLSKRLLSAFVSEDNAERLAAALTARDEISLWKAVHGAFSKAERAALSTGRSYTDELLARYLPFLPENGTSFERLLAFEVRSSLPENLLMLADKLSMAHSLEVRVPLLDPLYLETVERLPQQLRRRLFAKGGGKYLHKKVCQSLLPPEIVHAPKKGFETPVEVWMRGELGSHLLSLASDQDSFSRRHLSFDVVRDLILAHGRGGRGNLERQLFAIWMLEEWHRVFPDRPVAVVGNDDVVAGRRSLRAGRH